MLLVKNYPVSQSKQNREDSKKKAILLSSIGAEAYSVINSLAMSNKPAKKFLKKFLIN